MKIAVDVALLPPENIMDIVIELNQTHDPINNMNKVDNLPHFTLAMGVIEEEQIELVNEKLKQIAEEFSKIDLELIGITYHLKPNGKKSWYFTIKENEILRNLHGEVMKVLLPIFTYNVATDMFDQTDPVDPISTYWVENYAKHHKTPEGFKPHLSIKVNKDIETDLKFPIKFTASKFGLFHQGDHCTCRTTFGLFELK